MEKVYLNIKEASQLLGISTSTIYKRTPNNQIPHYKLGRLVRFKKNELIDYMESHKKEPKIIEMKQETNTIGLQLPSLAA